MGNKLRYIINEDSVSFNLSPFALNRFIQNFISAALFFMACIKVFFSDVKRDHKI